MVGIVVAIDGPAAAGKSTVAKAVAQALGFALVDTGAMYRCVALLASQQGVANDDEQALQQLVNTMEVKFRFENGTNHVVLQGEDVTAAIRKPEISALASTISAQPAVRAGLLEQQRRLAAQAPGAVLEGRDIGTVVCPGAQVKIFLHASVEERARRRCAELEERGHPQDPETVRAEVEKRDAQDTERAHAPLRPADDAIKLDSTKMTVQDVVDTIVQQARQAS